MPPKRKSLQSRKKLRARTITRSQAKNVNVQSVAVESVANKTSVSSLMTNPVGVMAFLRF